MTATYSHADQRLWVLESLRSGPAGRRENLRLLAVDTVGAAAPEVVGVWPRTGLFEQHFLRIDRDGAVLLFSSSSRARVHLTAKLSPARGNIRLVGFGVRPRSLLQSPVVDEKGYWLIEAGVAPVRVANLGLGGAPWSDLGRCF